MYIFISQIFLELKMGCESAKEKIESQMLALKLERVLIRQKKKKILKQYEDYYGTSLERKEIPDYIDPEMLIILRRKIYGLKESDEEKSKNEVKTEKDKNKKKGKNDTFLFEETKKTGITLGVPYSTDLKESFQEGQDKRGKVSFANIRQKKNECFQSSENLLVSENRSKIRETERFLAKENSLIRINRKPKKKIFNESKAEKKQHILMTKPKVQKKNYNIYKCQNNKKVPIINSNNIKTHKQISSYEDLKAKEEIIKNYNNNNSSQIFDKKSQNSKKISIIESNLQKDNRNNKPNHVAINNPIVNQKNNLQKTVSNDLINNKIDRGDSNQNNNFFPNPLKNITFFKKASNNTTSNNEIPIHNNHSSINKGPALINSIPIQNREAKPEGEDGNSNADLKENKNEKDKTNGRLNKEKKIVNQITEKKNEEINPEEVEEIEEEVEEEEEEVEEEVEAKIDGTGNRTNKKEKTSRIL